MIKSKSHAAILGPVLAASLVLGACSTNERGDKETLGAVGGAILGGIVGSQIGAGTGQLVAVGAGTLIGALVGSEIGKSLDRADQAAMERETQNTLERNPTGQAGEWRNPDSGNSGTVTPTRTYQTASGEYCREYTQTIYVGGDEEDAYGTACRQPDGSWRIVR